jgi:TatD DNase family protein
MIDSHCHLTDHLFHGDLEAVLQRAWQAGLHGVVSVASSATDAEAAHALTRRDQRIRATAGIHPHTAAVAGPHDRDRVRELLGRTGMVAIGETGLDFHYDNSPRDTQRTLFEWHLQLGSETGLPVVVHSRDAEPDTAAMIRAASDVSGVLHCFTGGADLLETALAAGWYISFAGLVSFRNFQGADLLRAVPADRLMIETDSPYLAPVPHRGRRNEPAFLPETCRAVAAARGENPAHTARLTAANARRFYGLEAPPRAQ